MNARTLLGLAVMLKLCMQNAARLAAELPVDSRRRIVDAESSHASTDCQTSVDSEQPFASADCSSGLPSTCDRRCATDVIRMHEACQSFLSQPDNKEMAEMIHQTYQVCLESSSANGN